MLCPALASAQNPGIFSTIKTTDTSATSACVGCTIGGTTATANSGMKVATISVESLAAPSITTNKIYNVSGALYWNGVALATGSTISGTTNTIGMFTGVAAMGNSLLTQSGSTVTMAGTLAATTFSGSGASLTAIPTSALTGNFVATLTAGTGLTISAGAGTGTGSTPTLSLANTAVTPAAYPFFTVDQQGRLTAASTTYTGAVNGQVGIAITNSTSGTGAYASEQITAGTTVATVLSHSQGFTTSGINIAASVLITGNGAGGVTLGAQDAAGVIRFVTGGAATVHAQLDATGNWILGTANITDAIATPTIASGFGSGSTITGKVYAFIVTLGTSPGGGGTVTFNATFANTPSCVASVTSAGVTVQVAPSTTQLIIATNGSVGEKLYVLCRGF